MTALIDTMLAEHKQIFAMLETVQRQGVGTEAGLQTLDRLRKLVLAHLAREDHKLYPPMHLHEQTRALAEEYEAEMHVISREVLDFFAHFRDGGDRLAFARALGRIVARLRARMTREEIRLYPAFRAHCSAVAAG
ncbi:hemerythrin domain-containing protein [Cupriavidus oxalaticus]|uniref:hemerythrin domain-containing protein n=1 Tax=Cupriavidus oxalaticus TaxID=96344 RepID=UPI00317E6B8F